MTEKIKHVNNPLTIIAIFATLAEISATVAIGLIDKELHSIFIWFVIGFPTLLVVCFFLTLNFNTRVMYSPSDYKEDKSFMDSLFKGGNYGAKEDFENKIDFSKISTDLENKLNEKILQRIETIEQSIKPNATLKSEIEVLKHSIKQITDESLNEVKYDGILKSDLKEKMLSFYNFPAYYLLLYAIVDSKATSIEELKIYSKKFYIPEGWEGGLKRLLRQKILMGNDESFKISEKYSIELDEWVEKNETYIKLMSREYEKKNPKEEPKKRRTEMIDYCSGLKF